MRVRLSLSAEDKIVLPIHHNHILQGFVYNSFGDDSLAEFLHDKGFKWKKRNFKLFTFSRLQGDVEIDQENEKMIFTPPVSFIISSIKRDIIDALMDNIMNANSLKIGSERLFLENIRVMNYNFSKNQRYLIKMLSSVTVYRTVNIKDSKKTHYFTPWADEFENQIKNNLKKKYDIVNDKSMEEGNFQISPEFGPDDRNPNLIIFKGFIIKGWMGKFIIKGDPELLKLGYDSGLGAKNSMGHGCFEVVKALN